MGAALPILKTDTEEEEEEEEEEEVTPSRPAPGDPAEMRGRRPGGCGGGVLPPSVVA
jgi:hypothetical protein